MTVAVFKAKAPKIMRALMQDFGFSVLDAAAILGNAGAESGGLTDFQEKKPTSGRGGWGWFQWTGPRRREFEAYCKRNGLDPRSDEANYAFLFVELTGTERAAVAKVKAAKDLPAKVRAFEQAFERAGVKNYAARDRWAKRALEAWNEVAPIVKPTGTTIMPADNSIPQRSDGGVIITQTINPAPAPQKPVQPQKPAPAPVQPKPPEPPSTARPAGVIGVLIAAIMAFGAWMNSFTWFQIGLAALTCGLIVFILVRFSLKKN